MYVWFTDEEIWKLLKGILSPDREKVCEYVERIVELTGIEPGARVLDISSREGYFSIEFARRGFKVTSIEVMKPFIESAKKLAKKEGLQIEFINDDIRNFSRSEYYDLIIHTSVPFGYFEEREDDFRVIKNMFRSLKNGGKFLLLLNGKELSLKKFLKKEWMNIKHTYYLIENTITENWESIITHWTVLKYRKRIEFDTKMRLFSGTEIYSILLHSGFHQIKLLGSLKGIPYNEDAVDLFALATK